MKDISAYFEANTYAIRKLGEAYRFPFPCPICHVRSATTWVEKQARTLSFCGRGCSDETGVQGGGGVDLSCNNPTCVLTWQEGMNSSL